jgi:hypothetical protein
MKRGSQFDWDAANVEHIACHSVTPQEAEQVLLGVTLDLDPQEVNSRSVSPA